MGSNKRDSIFRIIKDNAYAIVSIKEKDFFYPITEFFSESTSLGKAAKDLFNQFKEITIDLTLPRLKPWDSRFNEG